MKSVAIIPARGGSKRIPRKNVRLFLGKPALAHAVEAATGSGLFDRVIVSTEDDEIETLALTHGAEVMRRSEALADDATPIGKVCADVLLQLDASHGMPETFCLVYATAVMVTADDLVQSRRLLDVPVVADRVVSASTFAIHPFKALHDVHGFLEPAFPGEYRKNTQEYPSYVAHNGMFCWARSHPFVKDPKFVGGSRVVPYLVPRERAVDIDSPEDWAFAERLARAR